MRARAKKSPPSLRSRDWAFRRVRFFTAWFSLAIASASGTGSLQSAADVAPELNGPASPADPPPSGPVQGNVVKPLHVPDLLDGLDSLKLVKDPDFGPPIIDAEALFQGHPLAGAVRKSPNDPGEMKSLEANLAAPDLNAPSLQPGLEAVQLHAPNDKLPTLQIPDIFGPSMVGFPLSALAVAGPSMQQRPLGTLGVPSFMSTRHSFPIGNNRVRFGVSVDAGVAYNNNVFAAPSNPQGDRIIALQPAFYLETGKKGTMRFLWAPSVLQYAKYTQLNSINQTFVFSSRYRWTKLRVGLDLSYIAQSGLFLNSQGQAQQKAVYARLFSGYSLTKKTDLLFNFDGTGTESNPGGKQFQGTFTAAVDYRYSQKTTFGGSVALGYFYSSMGMTTSESFLLRLLYKPTSKIVFRGEGGIQFRQSSASVGASSSAVTSIVNLSLIYSPTSKTYVSMRFFRNVDMDAFNAGNLQITTGIESAASWKVFHSMTLQAALAAGLVENVGMSGQQLGNYNYVQGNLALTYMLTDAVNLRLFNNLQQRMNSTQGSNYLSNTSGMGLGMKF